MNEVGEDRGGRRKELEERGAEIGFSISIYQVYLWTNMIHLLPKLWKCTPINLHELIHFWLGGEPHQMIPSLFSMFHDIRQLENFPRDKINIMICRRL